MSKVKPYDVILADPPWRYNFSRSPTRRIENHYPTLTLSQVKLLGETIPAAANSVLFLWATAPKLNGLPPSPPNSSVVLVAFAIAIRSLRSLRGKPSSLGTTLPYQCAARRRKRRTRKYH